MNSEMQAKDLEQAPSSEVVSELEDSQLKDVVGGSDTAQNHELELQNKHAEEGGK